MKKKEILRNRSEAIKQKREGKQSTAKSVNKPIIVILVTTGIIAALLGTLIYLSYTLEYFNIRDIKVSGMQTVTREEIVEAGGLETGVNINSFRRVEARRNIEAIPRIDSVHIIRALPSTLSVTVTERSAVGLIYIRDNKGSSIYAVDKTGRIMPIADEAERQLIVLSGLQGHGVKPGDTVASVPEVMYAITSLTAAADINGLTETIREVQIVHNGAQSEYIVFIKGLSTKIYMGDDLSLANLWRLVRVVRYLYSIDERVESVDLESKDAPLHLADDEEDGE